MLYRSSEVQYRYILEGIVDGVSNRAFTLADGHQHPVQKFDPKLLAQCVEDGADKEGAEQALSHGAEGINAVALEGEYDVFAFEECFEFCHLLFHISFHKLKTAHAKKETPAVRELTLDGPQKAHSSNAHGSFALPETFAAFGAGTARPASGNGFLCRIFTNRKQWKYYSKGRKTAFLVRKAVSIVYSVLYFSA